MSEDEEEDAGLEIVADFLKRHEKQIGTAMEAWSKNMEREPGRRLRLVFGVLALVGVTVVLIGYLTAVGKVSSDAFTFLIGSVVGYLFSYLKSITKT